MYCAHCGSQVADGTKFCAQCGASVAGAPAASNAARGTGKLVRPIDHKIAGVCAAFANAYGWDVTIVRIITVLLALCGCGGVLAYLIAWVCIPEEPKRVPAPTSASTT
jgi:phage shock protein PspC (stress-responsive transcriptional regulator)